VNKKSLAALAAAAVLCVAAFAGVLVFRMIKGRGGAGGAEALPASSFVVARVDVERMRRWSAWASLRRMVQGEGEDAGARLQRLQGDWRAFVQRCGFDPLDRVDRVVAAGDRGILEGRSQNDWLAHASGRVTRAELQRCIEQVLQNDRGRLEAAQVEGRPVFTALASGDTPGPRQLQVHFRESTALAAPTAYMANALKVAYGELPRLGNEQSVGRMFARLNADSVVAVAGDIAAVRARNQQTTTELVDDLVRANPAIPDLTLARQVVTGGFALRTENGNVIATARAQMENANQGRAFTAAVQALVQARRRDVLETVSQVQAMSQLSRILPGQNLDAEWQLIDAAFVAVRAIIEQGVRVEQDGDTAVLTVTVNAQQVGALEQGVRAVQRVVGSRGGGRPRALPEPEIPGIPGVGAQERPAPPMPL